jgi:hypothetical protein
MLGCSPLRQGWRQWRRVPILGVDAHYVIPPEYASFTNYVSRLSWRTGSLRLPKSALNIIRVAVSQRPGFPVFPRSRPLFLGTVQFNYL